jgi:hypothetical protein
MARYSRRKFMAAGAALAAAPLMAKGDSEQKAKKGETVKIKVSLGPDGLSVDPCRVTASPGDTLEWGFSDEKIRKLNDTPFGIHFLAMSPVSRICLQGIGLVTIQIPEINFLTGKYGYFLAAFDGRQVWTIYADIIICPRPCPCPK